MAVRAIVARFLHTESSSNLSMPRVSFGIGASQRERVKSPGGFLGLHGDGRASLPSVRTFWVFFLGATWQASRVESYCCACTEGRHSCGAEARLHWFPCRFHWLLFSVFVHGHRDWSLSMNSSSNRPGWTSSRQQAGRHRGSRLDVIEAERSSICRLLPYHARPGLRNLADLMTRLLCTRVWFPMCSCVPKHCRTISCVHRVW